MVKKKKKEKVEENSLLEDAFTQVTKLLLDLVENHEDESELLVLEGAIHAVFHTIQHLAPSGLHSTQFIISALNDVLLSQIRLQHEAVEEAGRAVLDEDEELPNNESVH
tara:strand:- start:141 stop:467 length:327 start_codon:yes stop_codon:yes gene_type:complete